MLSQITVASCGRPGRSVHVLMSATMCKSVKLVGTIGPITSLGTPVVSVTPSTALDMRQPCIDRKSATPTVLPLAIDVKSANTHSTRSTVSGSVSLKLGFINTVVEH